MNPPQTNRKQKQILVENECFASVLRISNISFGEWLVCLRHRRAHNSLFKTPNGWKLNGQQIKLMHPDVSSRSTVLFVQFSIAFLF